MIPMTDFIILTLKAQKTADLYKFQASVGGFDPTAYGKLDYTDFSFNSLIPLQETAHGCGSQYLLEKYRDEYWQSSGAFGALMSKTSDGLKYYFHIAGSLNPIVAAIKNQFPFIELQVETRR